MNRNIGLDRTATDAVSRRAFMVRAMPSKLIRTALLSTALVAGSASAALFDVVVTTDMLSGDFVSGTDTVFGVAPAGYSVTDRDSHRTAATSERM